MILEKFEEIRNHYNQFFGQYEQIKKIALLDKEWTIESNELTPTMKTKRRVIQENCKDLIEGFYKE
jgi:long-chain acyl-CoA synthetase